MPSPIDPHTGAKQAITGRVVAMDDGRRVVDRGVVYIEQGRIVDVADREAPPPAGFEETRQTASGGTIFPGLIELHNHLAYNVLRLWPVPRKYTNRAQWGGGGNDDYRRLISGPMRVLGTDESLLAAVVRFVECKALMAGVTTTQGVALYSNQGARRYYRGVVRNVEQTNDPLLPEADARIGDVEAKDAGRFRSRLERPKRLLLHLSEGVDGAAREHFLALKVGPRQWALTSSLVGIHCAGLRAADFDLMARHGSSMVWSPLSNLLLYGRSARVAAAAAAGVPIGLGSDWSPTGSKNLLGELKAAWVLAQRSATSIDARAIVAMATCDAARILNWADALGTLEPTRLADLLVVEGVSGDPYERLLQATEADIRLVMVAGVARFGVPSLVRSLGRPGEGLRVAGRQRLLDLTQPTADPVVGRITLGHAGEVLADALDRLPAIAAQQEAAPPRAFGALSAPGAPPRWFLALDELAETGMELRPRLPMRGGVDPSGPPLGEEAALPPLSAILGPLSLDPLTVADDASYLAVLGAQGNLPPGFFQELTALYA